jgi:hypothetical protein
VAGLLQELAKTEFAGDAAEKLPRLEVNRARGGGRLSVGVFGDLRNIIAGIFLWVTVDGVGVENSINLAIVSLLALM